MGIPVLMLGESGTGKSYALRNIAEHAAIINVLNKPLPFRSAGIKTASSRDIAKVRKWVLGAKADSIIVDDFGYLITDLYMRYSYGEEKARDQFEVYKKIGHDVYGLVTAIQDMPGDKIVYLTMHTDTSSGGIEPLTIGKLLNEKVKLVGMFTITLLSMCQGKEYQFVTNGMPPAKTPPGMFDERIPNDLMAVDTAIRDYYGLKPLVEAKGEGEVEG